MMLFISRLSCINNYKNIIKFNNKLGTVKTKIKESFSQPILLISDIVLIP